MAKFNYFRHCRSCGDIKQVYFKKSKNCMDCVDEVFHNRFMKKKGEEDEK